MTTMMPCSAEIKDKKLLIGLPEKAFISAIDHLKDHTDGKIWIPDNNVIQLSDVIIEFRIFKDKNIIETFNNYINNK